jgi:adenosylcobinamide kinase/adenosylcobinamide-phosphate guanylyltransferase
MPQPLDSLPRLTLVLGGARSGKSRHAQSLIELHPLPWAYIATAQPRDDEMRARIAEHRACRGPGWATIEAPLDLARALEQTAVVPTLVDCLTLWLTNLMLSERDIAAAVAELEAALDARAAPTVLVANEVGLGIVPENALARRFRDEAGRLNQRLAARADWVLFMIAGMALQVK